MFHSQIPSKRKPSSGCLHLVCVPPETGRLSR
jgi:hypothetical protein